MVTALTIRSARFWSLFATVLSLAAAAGTPDAVAGPAGAAIEIAPHRAVYKMSLASARQSSSIADVRGKMQFEWADACAGWTIEQRFGLNFLYAEGEEMEMRLTYATWESKDGLQYRFNVRKMINGKLDEEVRGDANLETLGGPGVVKFLRPKPQQIDLPMGAMFPSRHTLELLEQASAGQHLFLRTVFDGADAEGPSEVNAVIGDVYRTDDAPLTHTLLTGPGWPVRLAFFPLAKGEGVPEYELQLRLRHNGIAEKMLIDYGDFTLDVVLEALETLPRSGC